MRNLLLLLLIGLGTAAQAQLITAGDSTRFRNSLLKHLNHYNLEGSMMIFSGYDEVMLNSDPAANAMRYTPASTYKIMNLLIALETGVIKDTGAVIKWDGIKREHEHWNKDQTIREAFHNSTVWIFQQLARKEGGAAIKKYLDLCRYGNADTTGGIDKFWLSGGLRISPIEQMTFLRKLKEGKLPFAQKNQQTVCEIMFMENLNDVPLYGKTGWGDQDGKMVGWFAGWMIKKEKPVFFVTMITTTDGNNESFGEARRAITELVMKDLNILSR